MYVAAATKKEENQRVTRGETKPQRNNQSSPIRRREEHMQEQNRVSEEKNINTQRQETEVVTGKEKVGK